MILKLKFNPNSWANFEGVKDDLILVSVDPKMVVDERFEFEPEEVKEEFKASPDWTPLEKARIKRDAMKEARFKPRGP